jgi:mono/diheme cytochrome c family protein
LKTFLQGEVVFLEFKNISSFARGALSTRRSCLVFALLFAGLSPASWSGAVDVPVERSGARVYQSVCALCHETRVGPPLLGRQLPPDLVRYFVRHGRNGMPAFRVSEISEAELVATARCRGECGSSCSSCSGAPVAPAPAPAGP